MKKNVDKPTDIRNFGIKRMWWSFELNVENSNLILTWRKAFSLM